MGNYFKLKEQAPNNAIYLKVDGKMVFQDFWDIEAVKVMLDKIDSQDEVIGLLTKRLTELEDYFRLMEQKLRQKGVRL